MEDINKKYASLALVAFPILECYNIGSIALYKFLMLFSCLFLTVRAVKYFYLPRSLYAFYIYAFTVPPINAVANGALTNFFGSFLTPFLFAYNLGLFLPFLDFKYIKKYYSFLVMASCVVFALQELSFITTGKRFCALIPFLDLYNGISVSQYSVTVENLARSCSFFAEPSHFAQYLIPYLGIVFHDLHQKRKIVNIQVLLLSLVLLLLRSGNGLLLLVLLWTIAILFSNVKTYIKYAVVFPASMFIVVFGFNYLSNTESGSQMLDRMDELSLDYERVSSGTVRVFRGFFVYDDMSTKDQLIGVGAGGIEYAVDNSNFRWMFEQSERYLNNASAFLVAYGIIGTLLFFFFLLQLCDKKQIGSILLVLAFIGLSMMESFFCNTRMLLYLGLASRFKYNTKLLKNEKNINCRTQIISSDRCRSHC